ADPAHRRARQGGDAFALEADLASGGAAGRLEQTDHGGAGDRLPGTRFAHNAKHLALRNVEGDAIDRCQHAASGRKFNPKVTYGKERSRHGRSLSYRSFGLSASRSQSPSRLTASTSIASATPGKIAIHHSPEKRKSFPIRIKVPREGCVGGTPTPRNDSVASVTIATARLMVAMTSTGPITFGSTWRIMIRNGGMPISRAAWTYSLFFSTMVEPRTVRANWTQNDRPIENTRIQKANRSRSRLPKMPRAAPSISSAIRIAGKVSWTSAMRMITLSTRPPT